MIHHKTKYFENIVEYFKPWRLSIDDKDKRSLNNYDVQIVLSNDTKNSEVGTFSWTPKIFLTVEWRTQTVNMNTPKP